MREIKFRAWDKVANKWLDYEDIYLDQEGEVYLIEERNWAYQTYMHKENRTENVEIVRFTGLNDKNGKAIYEGDILKVPSINDHVHGNYSYKEVIYRNGTWIAQYIKSEKGQVVPRGYMAGHLIDCYDYDYKALVFYDDRLEHTDIEIVGNIYENPEILENSTK